MNTTDDKKTVETLVDQVEIKTKLAAAKKKLAKVLTQQSPAVSTERRGAQTTIIRAGNGKAWCVTSMICKGARNEYGRDGESVIVEQPRATATSTEKELAYQKFVMVTEAALNTKFAKTIKI
jgi:hypothetical protein